MRVEKMNHYNQKNDQDFEDTEEDLIFDEKLKRILCEALTKEIEAIRVESSNIEVPPPTKQHKLQMNRLFRERVGGDYLPYPEVDDFYEKDRCFPSR
jgi:hypothetical protein